MKPDGTINESDQPQYLDNPDGKGVRVGRCVRSTDGTWGPASSATNEKDTSPAAIASLAGC